MSTKNYPLCDYESGLPFCTHLEFEKVNLDARQDFYLRLAERIWNPEWLGEETAS